MRTGMQMTIQDYFKNASIKRSRADQAHVGRKISTTDLDKFSRLLDNAQASADKPASCVQSLSIRDYLKNPVRTQRKPRSISKASQPPVKATSPEVRETPQYHNLKLPSPGAVPGKDISVSGPEKNRQIIQASIRKAARRYHLSPALLRAVIKAESNYQVHAVSPAGARGLMQLMPATAKELGVEDPFNIHQNIDGGAQYLRKMLNRFNGDLKKALSAYNAGPGTVARYNGQVPYPETRTYVARVLRYAEAFSDPARSST